MGWKDRASSGTTWPLAFMVTCLVIGVYFGNYLLLHWLRTQNLIQIVSIISLPRRRFRELLAQKFNDMAHHIIIQLSLTRFTQTCTEGIVCKHGVALLESFLCLVFQVRLEPATGFCLLWQFTPDDFEDCLKIHGGDMLFDLLPYQLLYSIQRMGHRHPVYQKRLFWSELQLLCNTIDLRLKCLIRARIEVMNKNMCRICTRHRQTNRTPLPRKKCGPNFGFEKMPWQVVGNWRWADIDRGGICGVPVA